MQQILMQTSNLLSRAFQYTLGLVSSVFLCCTSLGYSDSTLSSSTLDFDGHILKLDGNVVVNHPFGRLTSHSARLKKEALSKDFIFSRILLKDCVKLTLKNQATLECDLARIDLNTLLGDLTTHHKKGRVKYRDQITHGEKKSELILTSKSINFKILKNNNDSNKRFEIDHLTASGDVVALYDQKYRIFADKASYQKFTPINTSHMQKLPDGMIRLYKQSHPCHFESDFLQFTADSIVFDTKNSHLQMLKGQGTFNSQNHPLSFSSDRLSYKMGPELLTLDNNILIKSPLFGQLQAEDRVEIFRKKLGEIDDISHIKTYGPIIYSYLDHEFRCQGATHMNCLAEQFCAHYQSDSHNGYNEQIVYTNERFSVYADHAKMDYNEQEKEIDKLHLSGQVLVIMDGEEYPVQLALCEWLNYCPKEKQLEMGSSPYDRVLFWNRKESMSCCADELSITFEPNSDKQKLQSWGQVRFTLEREEQERLLNAWKKKQNIPY